MDPQKLQELLEQQLELIKLVTKAKEPAATSSVPESTFSISNTISEFLYDPESNVTFETWFRRYEDLFQTDLAAQDDAWKVRLLLRKLGPAELDKYSNLILPQKPSDRSFQDTIASLKQIFGEQASLFNTRYRCLKLVMNESDDFLTHVGIVNRECERFKLKSLTDDQFKSLILICSLQSPRFADIRTRLLNRLERDPTITLNSMAEEYQRLVNLQHDTTLVQSGGRGGYEVHAVQKTSRTSDKFKAGRTTSGSAPGGPSSSGLAQTSGSNKQPPSACWHCGTWHFAKFCSFKKHRCRKCNKVGHKDGYCQTQHSGAFSGPFKQQSQQEFTCRAVANTRRISSTFQISTPGLRKYVTILVNGCQVRLQLDTASDITIISENLWRTLGQPPIKTSSHIAVSACGGRLQLLGRLQCCVSFRGITFDGTCYVTPTDLNLMGLDWFEQLGLADVPINAICNSVRSTTSGKPMEQIFQQFAPVFHQGLGLCSATQAVLHLQPGAKAVFRPKRPVPYASLPQVDAELQRLEEQGVLIPVTYSHWAAPIVVVKKPNGSIRICADFSTGLNAALEQHHYPLPAPDDIFTTLNGGKCFAKLDLADAYLQIEVSPESRELLTINTHRGLFQYTRLPFGVKTAPAIFQQVIDTILSGIPGVVAYLDDVLIVAASSEDLQSRICIALQRIQESGFRLRPENANFFYNQSNIWDSFSTPQVGTQILKTSEPSSKCQHQQMSLLLDPSLD